MKVLASLSTLLVSVSDLSERARESWQGVVVVGVAFLGGMTAMAFVGDLGSHEGRIGEMERVLGFNGQDDTLHNRVEVLEAWQTEHVQGVTRPQVRRVGAMEEDIGQIKTWMERIEGKVDRVATLYACNHYEIRNCPVPRPRLPDPAGP